MKTTLLIVGGLLVLLGVVWALQGFNVLAGSAMSGKSLWSWIGGAMIVVGIVLGLLGSRMKKKA